MDGCSVSHSMAPQDDQGWYTDAYYHPALPHVNTFPDECAAQNSYEWPSLLDQYEYYRGPQPTEVQDFPQPARFVEPFVVAPNLDGPSVYSPFSSPSDEYRLSVARSSDAFLASFTDMNALAGAVDAPKTNIAMQPQEHHQHALPLHFLYDTPQASPESSQSPEARWTWVEAVVDSEPPVNPPPLPRAARSRKREAPPLTYAPLMGGMSSGDSLLAETTKKHTPLACLFCRGRKVACSQTDPDHPEDRTCKQCARRKLDCVFPRESRRGQHKRKRRVPAEQEAPIH